MPLTISLYIGRHFMRWFLIVFGVLTMVVATFDTIELVRRSANKPDATLNVVLQMAAMKLPHLAQELAPFAILFAAMTTLWRLTRSNELVVARSVGVSIWQLLAPALIAACAIGVFKIAAFNPLAAELLSRFERIESRVLKGQSSMLTLNKGGIWLRQTEVDGQSVIHATSLGAGTLQLSQVIVFLFDTENRFTGRLDAESSQLKDGFWELRNVWSTGPNQDPQEFPTYRLPTDLTPDKINDSFASPETMSIWQLPNFIEALEASGFSGHRHRLQFYALLAEPLLFCAMVLIAAPFSLRTQRRGGVLALATIGILAGFSLYFVSELVFALGLSATIPAAMAACTPAVVSTLLGLALLLHLEDG